MRLFASLIGLLLPLINAQTPGYDWNGFTATTLGCGTDSGALNVGLSQTLSAGATGLKVKQIAFAIYGTNAMPANIQLDGNPSTARLSTSGIQSCCAPNCDLAVQVAAAGQSWYNSPCGVNSCGGSSSQNHWYYMDFSTSAVGTIQQTGISQATFYDGSGNMIGADMVNIASRGSAFFVSYTEIIPSPTPTPSVTKSPVSPSLTASTTVSASIDRTDTISPTISRSVSASVSADATDTKTSSISVSSSRSESLSRTNSRSESASISGSRAASPSVSGSVTNSRSESASVSGSRAASPSVTTSRLPSPSFSSSKTASTSVTPTVTPYIPWFQGLVGCCHNSIDTSIQALNFLPPYPYPNMGVNRIAIQYWPLSAGTATFTIALMNVASGNLPGGTILASKMFSVTSPGSFPTYSQQVVTFTDLDPISSYVLSGDVYYALAFYNATPGIIDLVVGVPSLVPFFWNDLMAEQSLGTFYTVGETNPPEVTNWLQSANIPFVAVGAGSVFSSSPSVSMSVSASSSISATISSSSTISATTSSSSSITTTISQSTSRSATTMASQSTSISSTASSSESATMSITTSASFSSSLSQTSSSTTTRQPTASVSSSSSTSISTSTDASSSSSVSETVSGTVSLSPTSSRSITLSQSISREISMTESGSTSVSSSPSLSTTGSRSVTVSQSISRDVSMTESGSTSISSSPSLTSTISSSTSLSLTSTISSSTSLSSTSGISSSTSLSLTSTISSSTSLSSTSGISSSTSLSLTSTISSSTSLSSTSGISSSTSPSVSSTISSSTSLSSTISSSTSQSVSSTISSSTSLSSTSGISSSTSPSVSSTISSSTSLSSTSGISSSTSPSVSSTISSSTSPSVSSLVISSVSSSISSSVSSSISSSSSSSISSSISSSSSSSVTSSRTSAVTVSISASMSVLGISNSPLFLMSNASVSPTQNATGGNTIIVNDSSNNNLATILAGTALGSVLLLILSFIASRFGLSIPGLNGTKRTTNKDGTITDAPDNPDAPVDGDGKKPDGIAMTALTGVVGTLFGKKGTDMLNNAKTLATDPNSLLPESAQNLLKQAGIDPNKIVNDLENKASAKLQKAVGLTPVDAKDVTDVPDVEKGEAKPTSNQNKISTPTTKVLTPSTQTKSFSQNKTSTTSSELSSQPSSVKVSISTTPVTQAKPVIISLPSINENKSLDSLESPVYTPGTIVTDLNTIVSSPAILNESKREIKPIESTINNDAITFSPEIKQFLQKILQPYANESSTTTEPTNNNKLKSNKVEIEPVGVNTVINVENDNKSKQQNNNKSQQNNNKSQQNNNKLQQNNKPDTNSNKSILQPTNNNKNKNEKPKVKLEINAEELAEIRQILSKRNKNYKVIK